MLLPPPVWWQSWKPPACRCRLLSDILTNCMQVEGECGHDFPQGMREKA